MNDNDEVGTTESDIAEHEAVRRVGRIIIDFTGDHLINIDFFGPISAYMMLGAAGVLSEQANASIRDAIKIANRMRPIETAAAIPRDLRRPGS